ncbi:MAG: hypothetical protein HQL41_15440 [Alphaproteobacteria bacterium]|nr:hypothetical protein [Alphaproteobacteria bacterium]
MQGWGERPKGAKAIRECLAYLAHEARELELAELAMVIDVAEVAAIDACRRLGAAVDRPPTRCHRDGTGVVLAVVNGGA